MALQLIMSVFAFMRIFFDIILATEQGSDITLNLIHRETSLPYINVKRSNQRLEKCSMSEMVTPCHQIQRKRHTKMNDYSQKSIDDFELVLVTPFPKVTGQENKCVGNILMFHLEINLLKIPQREF